MNFESVSRRPGLSPDPTIRHDRRSRSGPAAQQDLELRLGTLRPGLRPTVATGSAFGNALHETSLAQAGKMMRNRGLGDVEMLHELGHGEPRFTQQLQYGPATRICHEQEQFAVSTVSGGVHAYT